MTWEDVNFLAVRGESTLAGAECAKYQTLTHTSMAYCSSKLCCHYKSQKGDNPPDATKMGDSPEEPPGGADAERKSTNGNDEAATGGKPPVGTEEVGAGEERRPDASR
jgi:hypothetical protein